MSMHAHWVQRELPGVQAPSNTAQRAADGAADGDRDRGRRQRQRQRGRAAPSCTAVVARRCELPGLPGRLSAPVCRRGLLGRPSASSSWAMQLAVQSSTLSHHHLSLLLLPSTTISTLSTQLRSHASDTILPFYRHVLPYSSPLTVLPPFLSCHHICDDDDRTNRTASLHSLYSYTHHYC